jgi:hypothetical protein
VIEPAEEYFENEATGVEIEEQDEPVITEPWDPDKIRVTPKARVGSTQRRYTIRVRMMSP